MQTSGSVRLLPPLPPWLRFVVAGGIVAMAAYMFTALEHADAPAPDGQPTVSMRTAVPTLDNNVLATALDDSREHRLLLEPEPLRHLLSHAIDVGPTVAEALGRPDVPVPIEQLRADPKSWRGRWLYYEGVVEDLAGPRDGNPIPGYSIYEATIRLRDGNHAMAAFSIAPKPEIKRGSWVRIEGYLMKLRDTTYPLAIDSAPMLVGREIQLDYEDWPPVVTLDQKLLDSFDDTSWWPGDLAWHTIEEDQSQPLWHLGAYARDTVGQRSARQWRDTMTINAPESLDQFIDGRLARGTPLRIVGTLILRSSIAAPANPANIPCWTVAWLQVREWGGMLIPIWVPKRVGELPERAQLDVHGYYYRRCNYEAQTGQRYRVPLFVAADLDLQVIPTNTSARVIGYWLAAALCVLVCLLWWSQHKAAKESVAHSRDMDARRRRRRQQQQPSSAT